MIYNIEHVFDNWELKLTSILYTLLPTQCLQRHKQRSVNSTLLHCYIKYLYKCTCIKLDNCYLNFMLYNNVRAVFPFFWIVDIRLNFEGRCHVRTKFNIVCTRWKYINRCDVHMLHYNQKGSNLQSSDSADTGNDET